MICLGILRIQASASTSISYHFLDHGLNVVAFFEYGVRVSVCLPAVQQCQRLSFHHVSFVSGFRFFKPDAAQQVTHSPKIPQIFNRRLYAYIVTPLIYRSRLRWQTELTIFLLRLLIPKIPGLGHLNPGISGLANGPRSRDFGIPRLIPYQ